MFIGFIGSSAILRGGVFAEFLPEKQKQEQQKYNSKMTNVV